MKSMFFMAIFLLSGTLSAQSVSDYTEVLNLAFNHTDLFEALSKNEEVIEGMEVYLMEDSRVPADADIRLLGDKIVRISEKDCLMQNCPRYEIKGLDITNGVALTTVHYYPAWIPCTTNSAGHAYITQPPHYVLNFGMQKQGATWQIAQYQIQPPQFDTNNESHKCLMERFVN